MKNNHSPTAGLFQFLICISLSACGTAVPLQQGQPAQASSAQKVAPVATTSAVDVTDSLEIRILGEGPLTPSKPDLSLVFLETQRVSAKSVVFPDPFSALEEPLFFVWNDLIENSPISTAHFSYELQDSKNIRRTLLHPTAASRDASQKIWFIPIDELLKTLNTESYDYSANDIHILKLDLVVGSAQHELLEIRFKLIPKAGP